MKDLGTGKEYTVSSKQSVIIGGKPPSADFVMTSDTMSQIHVSLSAAPDGKITLDTGSSGSEIWVLNEAGEKIKLLKNEESFSEKVKFSVGEEGAYVFEAAFSPQIAEQSQGGHAQESGAQGSGAFDGDVWISGLRTFAWLVFIGIVGIGISIGYPSYQWTRNAGAFVVPVGISCVVAFFTVAFLMVFLNIASDVRAIRNHLTKK
jgi:hypothetical protein